MNRLYCFTTCLALAVAGPAMAQNIRPLYYWNFDGNNPALDQRSGKAIETKRFSCTVDYEKALRGKALSMEARTCVAETDALVKNVQTEFSIEFLFKGRQFEFKSYTKANVIVRFEYAKIVFATTVSNDTQTDIFVIQLRGTGKRSYDYYVDNRWHHFVFTASTRTGVKEVWVDGELPEGFSAPVKKGGKFVFSDHDGFTKGRFDEMAFYNTVLPSPVISLHASEAGAGKSYSFSIPSRQAGEVNARQKVPAKAEEMDPLEFAPGYPRYNVQALQQLQRFPAPRYAPGITMKRNVSWMDINYLHRELHEPGAKGFGKTNPEKAVALSEEMAANWNYYLDIPLLRTKDALLQYKNPATVYGALVQFANKHPQYPYALILMLMQNKPEHAGFNRKTPFMTAQDLPATYYIKDAKGNPVLYNNRKWLSPLMPLDIMQKDARTSRHYLDQLLQVMRHPPALINENGEYFGHFRPVDLLQKDPAVYAHYKKSGLTPAKYSGWFQNRVDSTYRSIVMENLNGTHFSFYNVSAIQPGYWPDYAMRRDLNRWGPTLTYPTPDFYPRTPDNWYIGSGAYNGYGLIANGRATEIALGDVLFSPFVSAGWGLEEQNIRPAQWLALLKAMVMLGADFFYTGYFNVTSAGGRWPDGKGPNDPRGYAYQIAMPAYAQALGSYVYDFLTRGALLDPSGNDNMKRFRFPGGADNELIMVRQLGKRYLIYGSIQPNSNIRGNVPNEKITSVTIDGKTWRFPIRRQGSMYILDNSGRETVFYQLDAWHQYEHPYYWKTDYETEAEISVTQQNNIATDWVGKPGDVAAGYTTYRVFSAGQQGVQYPVRVRNTGTYYCYVRARTKSGKATLMVGKNAVKISGDKWKWYALPAGNNRPMPLTLQKDTSSGFMIMSVQGTVEVDKILFTANAST